MSQSAKSNQIQKQVMALINGRWAGKVELSSMGSLPPALGPSQISSTGLPRILVGDAESPERVMAHAQGTDYVQVVQKRSVFFQEELNSSALIATEPDTFVRFPISSILDPENTNLKVENKCTWFEKDFSQPNEKSSVMAAADTFLKSKLHSSNTITDVLSVIDELSTNAIYNAPVVGKGGVTNRSVHAKIPTNKPPSRLLLGGDHDRLVVLCRDHHGALPMSLVNENINKCFVNGVGNSINMGPGGAGIGLFMVYNALSSYYSVVKTDQVTLMGGVFPLNMSGRKRALVAKNLHCLQF